MKKIILTALIVLLLNGCAKSKSLDHVGDFIDTPVFNALVLSQNTDGAKTIFYKSQIHLFTGNPPKVIFGIPNEAIVLDEIGVKFFEWDKDNLSLAKKADFRYDDISKASTETHGKIVSMKHVKLITNNQINLSFLSLSGNPEEIVALIQENMRKIRSTQN